MHVHVALPTPLTLPYGHGWQVASPATLYVLLRQTVGTAIRHKVAGLVALCIGGTVSMRPSV